MKRARGIQFMDSKRIFIAAVIIGLISGWGCASLKKKQETSGQIQHQDRTLRFTGYKLAFKVKATPEEIGQYLQDFENLDVDAGLYKFRIYSKEKMGKLGDFAEGRVEIAGVFIPGKIYFVRHRPGAEDWFVFWGKYGGAGILRYTYKQVDGGTKVTVRYEVGELDSFMTRVAAGANLQGAISKIVEKAVARAQVHFDPSLKESELLEKGIRGEFFDSYYQGHEASVWIKAPPAKVEKYLRSPDTWEVFDQKYGIDLGQCPSYTKPYPCPVRLKILGPDYDIDSILVSYKPTEEIVSYWVSSQLVSRMMITLKAEQEGTRLVFSYAMEMPTAMSQEGGLLLVNMARVPETMGKMLNDVKTYTEGVF